jgi:hypothetical protein
VNILRAQEREQVLMFWDKVDSETALTFIELKFVLSEIEL